MAESHRISVHEALGGGPVADMLLWRKWSGGAVVLVASTVLWFFFEVAGYSILSFVANVLFLVVCILFFWGKSASLLNRPLPPLPDLEVSEESILRAADVTRLWINQGLLVARDITVDQNLKLFLQVAFGLWLISYVGSLFNLLTLIYLGVLLSLSVPLFYEKYQDPVDETLIVAYKIILKNCRKFDEKVLKKIPMALNKEYKSQ
ncbi:reticulon-like protein B11 [Diospyros lotus]|uniref:reticulon-like protein B11 n=1 Tax=Diospyros lotus TaxID=55363 RepID=UPI002257DC56|nr:reticulon-like protein B11 [Diospyros lotus]XP_052194171.1 reticulon-like protein B11 [Diospyros lotus]